MLAKIYQTQVQLAVVEQFESDHVVLRCAVHAAPSSSGAPALPGTLILKQRDLAPPADPHTFDQAILASNEWARSRSAEES